MTYRLGVRNIQADKRIDYFKDNVRGILCWHCCQPFPGQVHPLPLRCDAGTYHFQGAFCSWGCVKGYNLQQNGSKYLYGSICNLIAEVVRHLGQEDRDAAPNRECLTHFGGTLSLKEFRGTPGTSVPTATIPEYQAAPSPCVIPSKRICTAKSQQAHEMLRVKRSKQIPANFESLDSLGFTTSAPSK